MFRICCPFSIVSIPVNLCGKYSQEYPVVRIRPGKTNMQGCASLFKNLQVVARILLGFKYSCKKTCKLLICKTNAA